MNIFLKRVSLNLLALSRMVGIFFLGSCSVIANNAICYSSPNGIIAVRIKEKTPFAVMLFNEKKFMPLKAKVELSNNGKKLGVDKLVNSPLLLNKSQVKGQPCRWGPMKVGAWPDGTIEYNFEDFTLWVNEEGDLICVRLMVEGIKLWKNKEIIVKGNNISKCSVADFIGMLGENIEETKYFSEF